MVTMPALVFVQQCAEYQQRGREDKEVEVQRRQQKLSENPVDITPLNKSHFLWSDAKDLNKFEQEWNMKPVAVKGIFDHTQEIQVNKIFRSEKGVQIITPFYTHLDKDGKPAGILVNRGWVPHDLKNQGMHQRTTSGVVRGVLYPGDALNKWSQPNSPTIQAFNTVTPADFALIDSLPNEKEAG